MEGMAALQWSDSQKQSLPFRLLWDMHTWSTMNMLMRSSEVHVLVMRESSRSKEVEAERERKRRRERKERG